MMVGSRGLAALLLVLAVGPLAACAGDDGQSKAPPGSPENPLVAKTEPEATGGSSDNGASPAQGTGSSERALPEAASGEPSVAVGEGSKAQPGYEGLVEGQTSAPRSRFTPCNLVTKAQASAIIGAPLRDPVEAPQGPTCVYRAESGEGFVTVAVQTVNFKKLRPQLRQRKRLDISGRDAYCGQYGQAMLYMPLARGQVLTIAGRCPVARRFAATALRQL